MTIPASVQTKIDTLRSHLATHLAAIVAAQGAYQATHGRYGQLLAPGVTPPAGIPTWQESGFSQYLPDVEGLTVQVHAFSGGFLIVARLEHDGQSYSRAIDPLSAAPWMEHDWRADDVVQ